MIDTTTLLIFMASYVLGSLLPARVVIRRATGHSAEALGENPGGGASWRLAGPKGGALVMALDILKGALPVAVVRTLNLSAPALIASAIGPVIGHNWPIWKPLQGGKGFATGTGAVLALAPVPMVPAYAVGCIAWLLHRWIPLIGVVAWPIGLIAAVVLDLPEATVTALTLVMAIVLARNIPWVIANKEWLKEEFFSR